MADPLLTSLCTICHIQTPKYKCPRCATRTCSLQCITKHKKWASCSGERDPTVYLPPSKLKTDAGIDHDYNFLTKIERSIETADKIMREERDILPPPGAQQWVGPGPQQQQQHGHPNKRARFNDGGNSGRHNHDSQHQDHNHTSAPSRRWDKASHFRLRKLGIHVAAVPYGMTRSRENKTSWNKRTRTINWQVEWFVHGDADTADRTDKTDMEVEVKPGVLAEAVDGGAAQGRPRPTRIMYKILDETPLAQGFEASRESFRHAHMTDEERQAEKSYKKRKDGGGAGAGSAAASSAALSQSQCGTTSAGQNPTKSSWTACTAATQSPTSTAWQATTPDSPTSTNEEPAPITSEYKFFYQRPRVPARQTQKLVPLDPAESLAKILPGLEIVEFPTIHVFPRNMPLPEGYTIDEAPKHREMAMRSRQQRSQQQEGQSEEKNENGKRKAGAIVGYESSDDDDDDGPEEIGVGDGGGEDPADTTSSSGSSDEEEDSDEHMEE